jgi:CRISPR system Cascade subunit CasD
MRQDAGRHQRLQDRLSFGVLIERRGHDLRDFQTAKLAKNDQGWTTRGVPEGRDGGAGTYDSPHIRLRHYRADAAVLVALNLTEADEPPTLDEIASAFAEPARPLFIGRKPCLPSAPLCAGIVEAASVVDALRTQWSGAAGEPQHYVLTTQDADALDASKETLRLTGRRDWVAGVHAGQETRIALTLRSGAP